MNAWRDIDVFLSCRRGCFGSHHSWRGVEWDHRGHSLSHPGSTLHRSRGPTGYHRKGHCLKAAIFPRVLQSGVSRVPDWHVLCPFRVGVDGKGQTFGIKPLIIIFAFLRGWRPSKFFHAHAVMEILKIMGSLFADCSTHLQKVAPI